MDFPSEWRLMNKTRLLAASLLLTLCSMGGSAQAVMQPAASEASVTQTVWGILGYARWPDQSQIVQLCVVGETAYEAALQAGFRLPDGRQVQTRRIALEGSSPLQGCHVLYAGRLHSGQWQKIISTWLKSSPLLTLSEEAGACQQGGMFCLDVSRSPVGFELNLDSVARSGVRVNPRVLSLAKNKEGN